MAVPAARLERRAKFAKRCRFPTRPTRPKRARSSASPDAVGRSRLCLPCRKGGVTAGETRQAIEATFRIERAKLTAGLALVRNIDLAEELARPRWSPRV
jgi:hypothetical protein